MHAALGAVAGFLTSGLSWIVYPFFAPAIMSRHYLQKGWVAIDEPTAPEREWTTIPQPSKPAPDTRSLDERHPQFGRARMVPIMVPSSRGWSGGDVLFWAGLAICGLIFLGALGQIADPEGAKERRAQSETAVAASEKPSTVDNIAHSMLLKKTPSEQAYFLGTVVDGVGDKCTGAKAFYSGSGSDKAAFWSVRCTNGLEYIVQVLPDAGGSTKVLECRVLKAVGGPDCFKSFSRQ